MRVTPPINVDALIAMSTAAALLPSISEAMLTSSTVPEAPPAGAYAGGTTYALDDEVYVASGNSVRDVYKSLQASNTGHTPSSSPTWWRSLGRTYATWSGATTYALDDVVLDAANHLEYVSLQASNLNHAVTDTTWWEVRPSNRWRAIDIKRNTSATAPSPTTYVITPGRRVDTIGFTGLVADSLTITVTRAGVTIYSETINLSLRRTLTWSDYFFGAFGYREKEARFDLPLYTDGIISVTLARASGDVSVASIVPGRSIYLGRTIHDAQSDAESFSTIEYNAFGDSELIRRRIVPTIKAQVRCDKTNVPATLDARDLVNAIPSFWSGIDDADSGYFEPLLSLGVYTRFIITMDRPEEALLDLEIKEV